MHTVKFCSILKARYWSKIAIIAPVRVFPSECCRKVQYGKLECRMAMVKNFADMFARFDTTHERDGRTPYDSRGPRRRACRLARLQVVVRCRRFFKSAKFLRGYFFRAPCRSACEYLFLFIYLIKINFCVLLFSQLGCRRRYVNYTMLYVVWRKKNTTGKENSVGKQKRLVAIIDNIAVSTQQET